MKYSQSLKQHLIRGAIGSFGLKIISTGLAFLLNLLLAKSLGSEGLGTYALAITWIGLLQLPAKLGFSELLIRDVAIYFSQGNWGSLRSLIGKAYQIVFTLSFALALIVAALAWLWVRDSQEFLTLLIALIALPLTCLANLNQCAMNGLHKLVEGQLAQSLIAPLLMLLVTLAYYVMFANRITPTLMITFYAGIAGITALIGFYQLSRALPRQFFIITETHNNTWYWIHKAIPFMLLGALYTVHHYTDILMLGAIKGSQSVGLYVVSNKLASLIIFIFTASNSSLQPTIASLYAAGQLSKLERIVKKFSKIVLFFSCMIAVFIFLFKGILLGLFGQDFLEADRTLLLLITGQLFTPLVGPVALLLSMSGNEKISLIIFSLSAAINIALNYFLIPTYDVEGAAIATAISTIVWNLVSIIFVIKRLSINPMVFGKSIA